MKKLTKRHLILAVIALKGLEVVAMATILLKNAHCLFGLVAIPMIMLIYCAHDHSGPEPLDIYE